MGKFSPSDFLQELANMNDVGVKNFRQKFSGLFDHYQDDELLKRRDELRLLWLEESGIMKELMKLPKNLDVPADDPKPPVWEDGKKFNVDTSRANWLIEDWYNHGAFAHEITMQEHVCRHWIQLEGGKGWNVIWNPKERRIRASHNNLPKVLLMASIHYGDQLKFCHNSGCKAPFFLAKRKSKIYCSADCAAPAQRAAKRKWWRENRGNLAKNVKKEGK